jgi:Glucosidase II beta subunit-like protein
MKPHPYVFSSLSKLIKVLRVQDYLPDEIKEFIKSQLDTVKSFFVKHGYIKDDKIEVSSEESRALTEARRKYNEATSEVRKLRGNLERTEKDIAADYGKDDVFLAIKDECPTFDSGEYTYKVCFLNDVTQQSNKDMAVTKIGYDPFRCFNIDNFPGMKMMQKYSYMIVERNVGMVLNDLQKSIWNVVPPMKSLRFLNLRNVSMRLK